MVPSLVFYFSSAKILTKMVGANLKGISERFSNNFHLVIANNIEHVEDLACNPFLVYFTQKANEKNTAGNQENTSKAIQDIDTKWINGSLPQDFIDNILKNSLSILLRDNINYQANYMEIFVTDKRGVVIAATNKTSDYYQADETWWQKAYNSGNGENYIDKIGFDSSANLYSLDICLPIRDKKDNNVIGIIKAVSDIKKVIYPAFSEKIGETGRAGLISSDGTTIFGRDGFMVKVFNKEITDKIKHEKDFFVDYCPRTKEKMIFAAAPVTQKEFSIGDNMYVVISQNLSEAVKPVKQLIMIIFIVGFMTWIVVIYFVRLFLTRLVNVINIINEGMRAIESSKITIAHPSNARDELENLTMTFNSMVQAIKERDKLKVDKSELETISKELIDKNVELGEFIYSISHDLRAPVVSISGYSSILLEEYADRLDDEGKKYLKRISENTAFMEQLIHDLIDLSRAERINFVFQDVDVSEILEAVSSQFSEEIRKKKINFVVKSRLKKIYADKIKIIQVFNNLIGNAIKYIDTDKAPYIEIGGEMDGDFYKFYIKDNGIGISKANQSKIFKLFYRVEGTGISGTGVGLNIVKKIVERHQGKIWVESELGKGSTFYFTLYKSLCDINEKNDKI
ncbi:MAG: sensor histidine kinase [bacterium]